MIGRPASQFYRRLLGGVATACMAVTLPAAAKDARFSITAKPLNEALRDFGLQSGQTILADAALTRGKTTTGYAAMGDPETALRALLRGTGLTYRRQGNVFVVVQEAQTSQAPPPTPGADETSTPDVIVTAQRREEALQDVPIAVTAVSAQALNDQKIEAGSELLRVVPNVNFSKSNFSGYNFSIRGIGTKAISASSDPAVAVSFNSTPLIRNRLFEQEFFDLQRVEVLRGPQGTLYGRNATGGVVNILPALPTDRLEGQAWVEIGNYESRRASATLNVPLTDTLAVRVAGAYTKRDGFDYNSFNDTRVNGRDLWSTRATVQWKPSSDFTANLIWQHFEEDDDRARTGKQLCTRDPGPSQVGDTPVSEFLAARLSQGCKPGSLYDDAAYGTPNAGSFSHVFAARLVGLGGYFAPDGSFTFAEGLLPAVDPYGGATQSRNLREISTSYDPGFRAKNDVFQLNIDAGLGDNLRIFSQSLYTRDRYFSTQDYNRFVSNPVFTNTSDPALIGADGQPAIAPGAAPGGVYTDPQLGPSNRMLSVDISRSRSRQWSQEFRLQSSFDGRFNFSLGANYLDFKSQDDYYVFNNLFTFIGQYFYNRDNSVLNPVTTRPCNPTGPSDPSNCIYIDPNPLNQINGDGHNYFRSKNVVATRSAALFGEAYFNVTDNFKLTAGLRYTDDRKRSTPIPSQLLLGIGDETGIATGGLVAIGYPPLPDIVQRWRRFTGRLVADWKPELSFTDDTLLYASLAHGYKGGGSNPPRVDINPAVVQYLPLPETFKPESVNALEIGAKNSFDNGRLTLNATAFYYDYTNYQVSQIVDRISLNENFDARSMGVEFEAAWRPSRAFRLDANLGYLNTRIGKGAQSIDVMNRTQGNPDWTLVRPNIQVPSNCIAPTNFVEQVVGFEFLDDAGKALALQALCNGSIRGGTFSPDVPGIIPYNLIFGFEYNPLTDAPNGGRGFFADIGGNELPNSPHLTFNIGAQYSFFLDDWTLTFRGDFYRQSSSYARVYNTEYDRLRAWSNANLAITLERPSADLSLQFYVKNVFNKAPITDFFTNSDDTGLSANVFTLDPRIFGLRLTKTF